MQSPAKLSHKSNTSTSLSPLAISTSSTNPTCKHKAQDSKDPDPVNEADSHYFGPTKLMKKARFSIQKPEIELRRDSSSEDDIFDFEVPPRNRAISFGVSRDPITFEPLVRIQKESVTISSPKKLREEGSPSSIQAKRDSKIEQESINITNITAANIVEQDEATLPNAQDQTETNVNDRQSHVGLDISQSQVEEVVQQDDQTVINEPNSLEEERFRMLHQILSKLAKSKYRRVLAVCFALFCGSLLLELIYQNILASYRALFTVIYIFLTCYFIENVMSAKSPSILSWKKVENIFYSLDIIIVMIFVVLLDITISGVGIGTIWISIFSALHLFTYQCYTKAPPGIKASQIAIRTFSGIQLFLLSWKIDGHFDWPWQIVICFVWILIVFIGLYFLFFTGMLFYVTAYTVCRKKLYPNVANITMVLGFFWSTLYSGLGVIIFIGVITYSFVIDDHNEKGNSLVSNCLLLAKYISGALIVFTIVGYKWITDFLTKFNVEESYYLAQIIPEASQEYTHQLIMERKSMYFVKLSSTYFAPLNTNFQTKSKERFDKLKKAAKLAKQESFCRKTAPDDSVNHKLNRDETIIEYLKREKQGLDHIFEKQGASANITVDLKSDLQNQGISDKAYELHNVDFFSQGERHKSVCSTLGHVSPQKLCFSEGTYNYIQSLRLPTKNDLDEDLCYICCQRSSDAVFTACGHGGICTDCAIEVIQTKGQCMECRKNVEKVVRIDPDPKLKDIIRGYETITIVAVK